tara:strand:+ start:367 stop:1281 length:915 start_codon:yes stop_codon:yes gene_type:complete
LASSIPTLVLERIARFRALVDVDFTPITFKVTGARAREVSIRVLARGGIITGVVARVVECRALVNVVSACAAVVPRPVAVAGKTVVRVHARTAVRAFRRQTAVRDFKISSHVIIRTSKIILIPTSICLHCSMLFSDVSCCERNASCMHRFYGTRSSTPSIISFENFEVVSCLRIPLGSTAAFENVICIRNQRVFVINVIVAPRRRNFGAGTRTVIEPPLVWRIVHICYGFHPDNRFRGYTVVHASVAEFAVAPFRTVTSETSNRVRAGGTVQTHTVAQVAVVVRIAFISILTASNAFKPLRATT